MTVPAITRINGGLEVVAKSSATTNNGFYAPQLTTAQRDAITLSQGAIIYNIDESLFQSYQGNNWYVMNVSVDTTTGAGLDIGSTPLLLPTGTAAAVEVATNEEEGFMYYDTTSNTFKVRTNGAWFTIATV